MRFKGLDLNLLVALNALVEERSVTRAADRLHLSQPATSGALNRLRDYFNDDLIVAVGRNMLPTARGERIYAESKRLLAEIDSFITSEESFDPTDSDRRFRIAASDYAIDVLLAPVIRRLAEVAPGIRFEITAPGAKAEKAFYNGDIDAMILPGAYVTPDHPTHLLYSDHAVVMGSDQNPHINPSLTQAELLSLEHVVVNIGEQPGQGFPESQFKELRLKFDRAIVVPSFHVVPRLIEGTQRVALMHGRLAKLQIANAPLAITDNPFQFDPFEEWFQVHQARQHEPALKWLLTAIKNNSLEGMAG